MLEILFYHDIDAHVRYAIDEVFGHLGIPFAEFEKPDRLAKLSPTSTVLVLPETARISSNLRGLQNWLRRGYSVLVSAELLDDKYGDLGTQLLGGSVSSRAIGGNDPPRISGFLNIPRVGTLPVFYPFVYLEANGPCTVEGLIAPVDGTEAPAFCWYHSGRSLVVVYAIQTFRNVAYILEGCEAGLCSQDTIVRNLRDVHGNVKGRETELGRRGLLNIPIVDYYERYLARTFDRIAREKNVPFIRKSHFPHGKRICICPSHDVDHLFKNSRMLRMDSVHEARRGRVPAAVCCFLLAVLSLSPKLFGRVAATMSISEHAFPHELKLLGTSFLSMNYLINRLREYEREFRAPSTFFFLSNRSYMGSDYSFHDRAVKDILSDLVKEKCEIALHGSYHSSDLAVLDREKRDLGAALSAEYEIVGVRQHYLRLIGTKSWKRQVEAGFAYDSSLGYEDVVGFRSGCCLPFHPFDPETSSAFPIWEISPIIQDWTLHFRHGLDMASGSALQYCEEIAKRVSEVGGVLTLIWHPAYDDELFPGWNKTYHKLLEYCSSLDPWYATIRDLAEWWEIRNHLAFGECSWKNDVLVIKIRSQCAVPGLCIELTLPPRRELKDITPSGAASLRSVKHLNEEILVCFDMNPGDATITVNTQPRHSMSIDRA
jgi:peptidoglycan/xylan/chitin deacetylase (PgdA/CDA1 family)